MSEQAKNLGEVEISPQDDRSYRAIELENGLQVMSCLLLPSCLLCLLACEQCHHPLLMYSQIQVLLVQDKETDKASCAISVAVGSLFDGDVEGMLCLYTFIHSSRSSSR